MQISTDPPKTITAGMMMVDRLVELENEIARLKWREAELLEANNRYLARARSAEEYVKTLRKVVCHLAEAVGADALIAVVDDNTKLRAKLAAISARSRRRRWRPYV